MNKRISIIVPCYNEEQVVGTVLQDLIEYIKRKQLTVEIIVVDDASTDGSAKIISQHPVKLVSHRTRTGYGGAVKSGAAAAQYEWLLFYDADGQNKTENLDALFSEQTEYDMAVGARTGWQGPALRQPGKRIIKWVAEYLSGVPIPDVNSGVRIVHKDLFGKFRHLCPDGFSLSTTLTIAALKDHSRVVFVPIASFKRSGGRSTVRPHDAFTMLMLIMRLITVFSPLRLFTRVAAALAALGLLSLVRDIVTTDIRELTVFFFLTSLIVFLFGLIADQIAELRRQL